MGSPAADPRPQDGEPKRRGKKGKKFVEDKSSLLSLAGSIVESKQLKIKEKITKSASLKQQHEHARNSTLPKKVKAHERLENAKVKIVERRRGKTASKKTKVVDPASERSVKKKAVTFA